MRTVLKSVTLVGLALLASVSFAQSARDIRGPAPVLQIQAEPPAGLKAGAHKVLIELTDPVGKVLDQETVNFTVPPYKR